VWVLLVVSFPFTDAGSFDECNLRKPPALLSCRLVGRF
jgi:hypothetical protein